MTKNPESGTSPGGNLWDALFGEIGDAVADVRDTVVLEPWFGPSGSGESGPSHSPTTQSVAEELGWVKSERDNAVPETAASDRDHGAELDR